MRTSLFLFMIISFSACRIIHKDTSALNHSATDPAIHNFLDHEIYDFYRKGYNVEYGDQISISRLTQIDERNVERIAIDKSSRSIKIVTKNPHPEFVSAKSLLDNIESRTGSRNCLLVYNGVPYTSNLLEPFPIDSFKIEKTIYKGFITLRSFDSIPRSATESGKIIFLVYPKNPLLIDSK